jgi:hypothetical protein
MALMPDAYCEAPTSREGGANHLFASFGELGLVQGDLMQAQAFADQCLGIATRTKSRKNSVKGWRLIHTAGNFASFL